MNDQRCMVCEKAQPIRGCRGLCMKCYSEAKHKVQDNETTWEELAKLGLCQKEETPLERKLREAKERQ